VAKLLVPISKIADSDGKQVNVRYHEYIMK
jgi:hypothetical protein